MYKRLIITVGLLVVCFLIEGCTPAPDFDSQLSSIVNPHYFSIAQWEFQTMPREVDEWLSGSEEEIEDKVSIATEYFSLFEQIKTLRSDIAAINAGGEPGDLTTLEAEVNSFEEQRAALEDTVEKIIEEQVKETLAEQGIFHPLDSYIAGEANFPPVNFELGKLPRLLVVSPRDRIESMREITLQHNLSLEEIEAIESRVDELGVSSLVVELGGIAVYPSFVANNSGLRATIDAVTEEWVHQYLFFKPLGFLYLMDLVGMSRNYELATMNETLASMVSKEIGLLVCEKYYSQCGNEAQSQPAESGFDFNQEMREIRIAVDTYLARGEVEETEEFMEQKRQHLASMGYYIRKLNQAYFAFHGAYADSPTSISPIGAELKEMRSQSASLRDFLNRVAAMSSRQDLTVALKERQ